MNILILILTNGDIQTMFIEQNNILEITNTRQVTSATHHV